MKKFFALFLICLAIASGPAFAGFGVQEDGVGEGEAGIINCSTDIDCDVSNNKVTVTVEGTRTQTGGTIDNSTIGATTPSTGIFTDVRVTAATPPLTPASQYLRVTHQYLVLYTYQASNRPASGAPAGSTLAVSNATGLADCGTAGGGSTYVVCSSSGTNWVPLTYKAA